MSTLGDPMTDLGTLLAYWSEEADDDVLAAARVMAPSRRPTDFPTRSEIIRRYAARTGFDVSDVEWYQAFAFFKLAVVCQGIAARAAGGAMLGSGFDDAQRARGAARRGGPAAARHRLSASARQAPDRERPVEQPDPPRARPAHRTAIPPSTLRT